MVEQSYSLCGEANFISEILEKKDIREKILPTLPRGTEKSIIFDDFISQLTGSLFVLIHKQIISQDIIQNIIKLISKYFPGDKDLDESEASAVSIISLAITRWLMDRKRAALAIILYPSNSI